MRSMTAFGKASFSDPLGAFQIEIHSLNRKNLEISVVLPKEFGSLDLSFRKIIQKVASRGTVAVKMFRQGSTNSISKEALLAAKHSIDTMAKECGLSSITSISELLECALRFEPKTEEIDSDTILAHFEKAVDNWNQMREIEGENLSLDILGRLSNINMRALIIEEGQKGSTAAFADRLKKRLDDVGVLEGFDDARVIKEVVIFSEKVDTTEEIVRLKSHLKQFEDTLKNSEEAIGRKLDFLIQEMNREVNSLSVKCQDLELIKETLEIKSEIEKIREQVQNIE
jgi:uncharacterized protein (TIGR00255 family)